MVTVGLKLMDSISTAYKSISIYSILGNGQAPTGVDHIFEVICKSMEKLFTDYRDTLTQSGSPTDVEEHYHGTIIKSDLSGTKKMCGDSGVG